MENRVEPSPKTDHFDASAIRAVLVACFLSGFARDALAQKADLELLQSVKNATDAPQQADLMLGMTVDNASPNVGDVITFTIAVTNNGPDPATNLTVQDYLPTGLTFLTTTSSQGTFATAGGIWSVGTVSPGMPPTLLIEATVASPSPQINPAAITHSDQFDPDLSTNTASVLEAPPLDFFSVPQCRIIDTRDFVPIPPPSPGGLLLVALTGGACGIPSDAAAVAVNLTATQPTAAGSVVIYPFDQPTPMMRTVYFEPGQTRANNALVLLATNRPVPVIGPDYSVFVFNDSVGPVHVIIDVVGYFK
jgi:uncharacterized repeat protein (TIGR01451 family)